LSPERTEHPQSRLRREHLAVFLIVSLLVGAAAVLVSQQRPGAPGPTAPARAGQPERFALALVTQAGIGIYDSAGTELRRVPRERGMDSTQAWSPDGKSLVYRVGGPGGADLFVRNGGGAKLKLPKLLDSPRSPSWSPDSRRIVFVDARAPATDGVGTALGVVNADGTGLRKLPTGEGTVDRPLWSPDGARIVYGDANGVVFVVGLDGRPPVRLTPDLVADSDATWSPDGARLAVDSIGLGDAKGLVVMNSDGTGRRVLNRSAIGPFAWSPDGSLMAVALQQDKANLAVISLDGTEARIVLAGQRLSDGAVGMSAPVWSPDGQWLAVAVLTAPESERLPAPSTVYVVRADGTGLRPIGEGSDPQWVLASD
jgi:Tol biopolymer transport system component